MKLLPFFIASLLLFIFIPPAIASTIIEISNNGEGSKTSIDVRSNTGGNYINGQEVSSSNGSSRTRVEVNGKVYVDETNEGGSDASISVKQEGNKEPEVTYKKESAPVVKESNDVKEKIEKEVKAAKIERSAAVRKVQEHLSTREESLFVRLEALFDKLRSIFQK